MEEFKEKEKDKDILIYDLMESDMAEILSFIRYDELSPYVTCFIPEITDYNKPCLYKNFSYKIDVEDGLYKVTVYDSGFESIDPILIKLKESRFKLEELNEVIRKLSIIGESINSTNIIKDVNTFDMQKCKVVGCISNMFFSAAECYDEEVCIESEMYNVYLQREDSNLYMIQAFRTKGMCGSGYTTASWGLMNLYMIKELPIDFEYIPKNKENEFEIFSIIDEDDDSYSGALFKIDGIEILEVDYNGGDGYYPSGQIYFKTENDALELNESYKKNLKTYEEFKPNSNNSK